jgi:high affinity sulfate transporter 1
VTTDPTRAGGNALIPSLGWARAYQGQWLRPDIIAGLTAAAVVIPKAMAYAAIAGLPVQVGLYTVFVPMLIYALLGTSRPLSFSTTTTIAILVAAELGRAAPNSGPGELIAAAAALSVLVGAFLVVAFALRLGFLANFISEPVLTGFKSGIGLVIVVDQIPKLLGIHFEKGGFVHNIVAIAEHLPQTKVAALLLSLAVLGSIYALHRFTPRVPAPLLVVVASIVASVWFNLPAAGVETVGQVPGGFPQLIWPRLDLFAQMWPGALGIALMSFTETIAAARAFGEADEPRPVPNQELLAVGIANIAGGLLGAMPAGGGTTQTAVNRMAGARTQLAELVTAGIALATLLFLAPLIAPMPQAVLAAIVVAYSIGLISPKEFLNIRHVRHVEFYWAVIALAGVVLLGTLKGILVAVIASLVALAYQTNNPPVYALGRKRGTAVFRSPSSEHRDDETWPGLLILRTEGRVFFANAQGIGEKMTALVNETNPSVVLLDCSAIPDLEYTALKMLVEAEEQLRRRGISLWLAALNPEVLAVVRRSQLADRLGRERMFFNLQEAVERYALM